MKLRRYNKATAAIMSGALVAVIGALVPLDGDMLGAVQTLLTAVFVWFVPNEA